VSMPNAGGPRPRVAATRAKPLTGMPAVHFTSLLISPTLASVLLHRPPRADARREPPSPVMPVITAEGRALCRAGGVASTGAVS
jgi:hypothetical protein